MSCRIDVNDVMRPLAILGRTFGAAGQTLDGAPDLVEPDERVGLVLVLQHQLQTQKRRHQKKKNQKKKQNTSRAQRKSSLVADDVTWKTPLRLDLTEAHSMVAPLRSTHSSGLLALLSDACDEDDAEGAFLALPSKKQCVTLGRRSPATLLLTSTL